MVGVANGVRRHRCACAARATDGYHVDAMTAPTGPIPSAMPTPPAGSPPAPRLPSLAELGSDLLKISRLQRALTVLTPFACVGLYLTFAWLGLWPLAVLALVYLSFVTCGSISHDLVHRTLGLPRRVNDFLLTVIELLAFRSGYAYRLVHLLHHARFPLEDDIAGAA